MLRRQANVVIGNLLITNRFDLKVKKVESRYVLKQPQGMFSHRDRLNLFYLFELEQNVRSSA